MDFLLWVNCYLFVVLPISLVTSLRWLKDTSTCRYIQPHVRFDEPNSGKLLLLVIIKMTTTMTSKKENLPFFVIFEAWPTSWLGCHAIIFVTCASTSYMPENSKHSSLVRECFNFFLSDDKEVRSPQSKKKKNKQTVLQITLGREYPVETSTKN
mgnify:CR=1 FL=1